MNRKFYYCLLLVAIALASCTRTGIRVKRTNFGEEVLRTQNLVFTFNRDLISDSALMNKWDTTVYMRFEPAIPGKFMWTGKNELTFSPSGPLAPASNYKAIPEASLAAHLQDKLPVIDDPVEFHTPYLKISSTNAYWALSEDPAARIEMRLQITFNNPVSPAKLRPLLNIETGGKHSDYSVLSQSEGEMIEIIIPADVRELPGGTVGTITIAKGLGCPGGNNLTSEAIRQPFTVPSSEKLEIISVETGFDKGKGIISVFTSQPVITEGLEGKLSVDPPVAFTTELMPNGFLLSGDFRENQAYTLHVASSVKSVFGRELGQEYTETVAFGSLEPYIGFVEKNATYLSTRGNRNLAVQVINVPTIKVSVFKIFENNILHYLRQGKNWDYVYENDEYHDFYGYAFDENYGRPVFTRQIQTRSLPRSGNYALLNLDLDQLRYSDPFKGIYLVKVESTDRRWLQDVQMLSLSDLGMIVKEGSADVMVFVNSLVDASPVKGVKVEFISSNNQKVYSATTDSKGVALLRNLRQVASGFRLAMVTARHGDDFNFIRFERSKVETSRFDVGGKRTANLDQDVFIYGDRNLYRPGDTVNINMVVRTLKWQTVKGIPIKTRLIAPNGKEYMSQRKELNENGAAPATFYIPRQAMTGTYVIEAYAANNVLLASRRISVEEFIPDRIKVTQTTDKNSYLPGETIQVGLLAENLYGTPATGRKAETELRLVRKSFRPAAFADHEFSINTVNMPVLTSLVQQGQTDASGKLSQSIRLPALFDIGLVEGSLFSTVFDETGRPVNRIKKVDIPTQLVFYGIRSSGQWVSTRKPVSLHVVAVDKYGKALASSRAKIIVSHYRYETVIERGYNRYNYISQKKETVMLSKEMAIPANGLVLPFTPARSGEYEVKIMAPGGENYVSTQFYAYGWNDTDFSSFEVSREGDVTITADKNQYAPGDKARLLFKAPFDGQMLVTFEQNNVLEYRYIDIKNKSASLDLRIDGNHLPNLYIEATAFRKTTDAFMPLTVAHGVISLKVDDPSRRLKVGISAPARSRSGTKQMITINTQPNAEVTLAIVDEGILQVTSYKSPDPYDWFYQKRALEVNSYDVYGDLYPELSPGSSSAGGEAFDLARRINPLTGERVKLISKWSGILRANSSGQCSYMLDIPVFSGALRVMAVAYKDNRFGAAEQMIRVADPVVISLGVPRFLSPGDKTTATVSLSNTTTSGSNANVRISASGPLQVAGNVTKSVYLKAGAEQQLTFDLNAANSAGNASVVVTVTAMRQKFTQEISLPVRPASSLTFYTGSGVVTAGNTASFKPGADMIPLSEKASLVLSRSPIGRFSANLNSLLRYPYGCLEQTVSTAFPQLYFSDLVQMISARNGGAGTSARTPDHNVQQAIYKVESQQLYNGGFSLWENGGNADWWASAYATQFLMESRKAGFEIQEKVLEGGLRYLEQKVKERETSTWFYRENNVQKSKTVPRQEIFYSLYVLALADRASIPSMNYYKSMLAQLTPESKYLLAASYLLEGDRKSYQSVLPRAFGNEKAEAATGGYYGSYLRDLALSANALLEADPNNPQAAELIRLITAQMGASHSNLYTTQENAFALLAIGKQARRSAASAVTASVSINGKQTAQFSGSDLRLVNSLLNKNVSINAKGSGALYYSWELSGIGARPLSGTTDNYIQVRKRFLDRNGKEITGSQFTRGELIIVEVTARAIAGRNIENVAITDLLPACFEIENSRLTTERDMTWMKQKSIPDYTDIRDDRISFFSRLSDQTSTFYYTVRVVSQGTFTLGPVSADAMYDASCHSYSGSRILYVK